MLGRLSAYQFWNRFPMWQNWHGSTGPIVKRDLGRIDSKMTIDRRQEVAHPNSPLIDVCTVPISRANHLPASNASAPKQERNSARPVVSTRLLHSATGIIVIRDAGSPPKLAGDHHHDALI